MELDTERQQAVSLLGRPLYAQRDTAGVVAPAEAALAEAPDDLERLFALGQAYHQVWRYADAVAVYARAVERYPDNPLVYRHRGHRLITLRRFDAAIEDLERGTALDDGSFDLWYHLGLARYLSGDFVGAAEAYHACMTCSTTGDKVVATSDWLYMTFRRLGQPAEAAKVLERITPEIDYGPNISYYNRLMVYKGVRSADGLMTGPDANSDLLLATEGYGLGNWKLYNGDETGALDVFRRIVDGSFWPAFGFIAAEAELARRQA